MTTTESCSARPESGAGVESIRFAWWFGGASSHNTLYASVPTAGTTRSIFFSFSYIYVQTPIDLTPAYLPDNERIYLLTSLSTEMI